MILLTFLHLAARHAEIFRLEWSGVDFGHDRIRLWTRKCKNGAFKYYWLSMTRELQRSIRWWWEHRPTMDKPQAFLCQEETAFTPEYYGQPFKIRLQFMRRICDKANVRQFDARLGTCRPPSCSLGAMIWKSYKASCGIRAQAQPSGSHQD